MRYAIVSRCLVIAVETPFASTHAINNFVICSVVFSGPFQTKSADCSSAPSGYTHFASFYIIFCFKVAVHALIPSTQTFNHLMSVHKIFCGLRITFGACWSGALTHYNVVLIWKLVRKSLLAVFTLDTITFAHSCVIMLLVVTTSRFLTFHASLPLTFSFDPHMFPIAFLPSLLLTSFTNSTGTSRQPFMFILIDFILHLALLTDLPCTITS